MPQPRFSKKSLVVLVVGSACGLMLGLFSAALTGLVQGKQEFIQMLTIYAPIGALTGALGVTSIMKEFFPKHRLWQICIAEGAGAILAFGMGMGLSGWIITLAIAFVLGCWADKWLEHFNF